jgi:hypothetical protein
MSNSNFLVQQLNREIEAYTVRLANNDNPEQSVGMQRQLDSLLRQRQLLRVGFQYPRPKAMAELQPA